MDIPRLSKSHRPLPWILAAMTGGILLVGTTTYLVLTAPSAEEQLENLTEPVQPQNLSVEIEASGIVEPVQSVNISPEEPGRLVKLLVEQGDRVKAGQTLAVMKNDEIRAQGAQAQASYQQAIAALQEETINNQGEIQQTQARLAQAQASLAEAENRIPRQIEQAQAQLRSAQAQFELAGNRIQRNQFLLQQGAISQDEYDAAQNELRNAYQSVEEARERLNELQNTSSPEIARLQAAAAESRIALEQARRSAQQEEKRLQAAVVEAQANLAVRQVQFYDTVIAAPFDGVVTQKYATEGAFVTPTTSASTTASATSSSILALARGLEVVAKVPEIDVGQLQSGQPVKVVAEAYPDRVFQGRVRRIAPEAVVEQNVTSFEVTIALLSGQDLLRSKMNVDVTFLGQNLSNTLAIPTVAIDTREGETGVWVPDAENKPEFKPVTVGLTVGDQTQILEGLTPGERVFIDLPEGSREEEQSSSR